MFRKLTDEDVDAAIVFLDSLSPKERRAYKKHVNELFRGMNKDINRKNN